MTTFSECLRLLSNYSGLGNSLILSTCVQLHATLFSPYLRFVTNPDGNRNNMLSFRLGTLVISKPNMGKTRAINYVVKIVDRVWQKLLTTTQGISDEDYRKVRSYFFINQGSMEMIAKNIQMAHDGLPLSIDEEKKPRKKGDEEEYTAPKRVRFNQFFYFNDEFGKAFKSMVQGADYTFKMFTLIAQLMTMSVYSDSTVSRGRIYIDGSNIVVNGMIAIQLGSQLESEFFDAGFSRRFLPVYEETKKSINLYKAYSYDQEIIEQLSAMLYPIVEKMHQQGQIMVLPNTLETEDLVSTLLDEKRYAEPANQYVPLIIPLISAIAGSSYVEGDSVFYTYEDVTKVAKMMEQIYIPAIDRLYLESRLSYKKTSRTYYEAVKENVLNYIQTARRVSWTKLLKQFSVLESEDVVSALIALINSGDVRCGVSRNSQNKVSLSFEIKYEDGITDDWEITQCIKEIKNRLYH